MLLLLVLQNPRRARPACTESALLVRREGAERKEWADIRKGIAGDLVEVDRMT